MIISETVGIDVSKETIDVRIHTSKHFSVFENSNRGFKKMGNWVNKNSTYPNGQTLFIFEHTGLYSHKLAVFLSQNEMLFAMIPGLHIKRSLGIARGKNDKIDATKIALYGYRLKEEIQPQQIPTKELMKLKHLVTIRDRLVRQRAGYKASLREYNRILLKKDNKILIQTQERLISSLSKHIDRVEKEMNTIIYTNGELKEIYELIISIKGIGVQTAMYLIVYTGAFKKFANARKFASYSGVAPFPNKSGTSIRGKTRVSHLANKKMKTILEMCARSAIQYNPEMKAFYNRRLQEGKQESSTLNIIRNKLLFRAFAVVNRRTPYVNTMKYIAC